MPGIIKRRPRLLDLLRDYLADADARVKEGTLAQGTHLVRVYRWAGVERRWAIPRTLRRRKEGKRIVTPEQLFAFLDAGDERGGVVSRPAASTASSSVHPHRLRARTASARSAVSNASSGKHCSM